MEKLEGVFEKGGEDQGANNKSQTISNGRKDE
jgi:hypothetical protein